jgi:hypothetical protein
VTTDSGARSIPTPARDASRVDAELRLVDPLKLYTVPEAAAICQRTAGTICKLLYIHQLPRKTAWTVRRGHRQRCISLRPDVVLWLRRITLEGNRKVLQWPPQ